MDEKSMDRLFEEEGADLGDLRGIARVTVVKSLSSDGVIEDGQAKPEKQNATWGGATVVDPKYQPEVLLRLYDTSDTLRQCVDAITQNVHGHGWVPESTIDLDADDAMEQVATAMYLERCADSEDEPPMPTKEEVEGKLREWKAQAKRERARLKLFFHACCFESSFTDLRLRMAVDQEVYGWGAWEVVRKNGKPIRLLYVPAGTLRLTSLQEPSVTVEANYPVSPAMWRTVKVERRFRFIVQVDELGHAVYFKEYGDPRVVSASSGQVYETEEALKAKERDARAANEILFFDNPFPGTPYGNIRWHGLIPNVIGNRLAQDLNTEFLEDSAIPRGLLLVSDGRLSESAQRKLQTFFDKHRGKAHNRIAVIEASTPREQSILEGAGSVKMEYVSLREAQREDVTFAKYQDQNSDKVGESFRLPPLLRGKTKDFNRATAQAAVEYAEDQVCQPQRERFDSVMNRCLLPDLGIHFWRFASRGPVKHDPEVMGKVTEIFLKYGVVTPSEMRPIAERLIGIDLMAAAGEWQRLPLQMVLAGHTPPQPTEPSSVQEDETGEPNSEGEGTATVQSVAKSILELQSKLTMLHHEDVAEGLRALSAEEPDLLATIAGMDASSDAH